MADEGGNRSYWRSQRNVNMVNGNLHFVLGPDSCVTCGGGAAGPVYPNPQDTKLHGPVLVFNSLGTPDTSLGPKWMLPWHASFSTSSGVATLIDADGTSRSWTNSGPDWLSDIEADLLDIDGSGNYIVTRFNGDVWTFDSGGVLQTILARPGHTTTLAYDGSGNLETVTDAFGRVISYFYIMVSGNTRLNEIREPAPGDVGWFSTYLQYDASANLIAITNPVGETTGFAWTSGDMTSSIDGHGNATVYTYDGSGRVDSITDPDDPMAPPPVSPVDATVGYASGVTTFTNRLVKDTVYHFDGSGRVTKITDANSNGAEFTWDSTTWEMSIAYGHKIDTGLSHWSRQKTIFTHGNTTPTQHELWSQEVRKITDTNSTGTSLKTESWTYNTWHDPLHFTDARGKLWQYAYQLDGGSASTGLLLTLTSPLSIVKVTNTYDSGQLYRLTSTTDGVSSTTTYDYDQNTTSSYGNPDRVTTQLGHITNYKIDIRGRAYEVTDPTGNPIEYEFDSLDRLTRVVNADGTASEKMFDCCHLVAELDENKSGPKYQFDWMGRLVMECNACGDETVHTYDTEGQLKTTMDARGFETDFTYDDVGQLLQVDFPGGWGETYTYWEPGMLKSKTNTKSPNSSTIDYDYDDLYQLNQKTFPSGTPTQYTTDAAGLRSNMQDASGEKRYYYDDDGRLEKIEQGPTSFVVGTNQNYVLVYTWTDADQRLVLITSVRTQTAAYWTNTYTGDGQLYTVLNPDGDYTKHEYLDDGRIKVITNRSTIANNETREFYYQDTDASNAYVAGKNRHLRKLWDRRHGSSIGTTSLFEYELDAAGRHLSMTDLAGTYTPYALDPSGQLKSETNWSAKTPGTRNFQYGYVLDPNGNRLQEFAGGALKEYTYGDNNEMLTAGSDSFTYDEFGNTAAWVAAGTSTFTWDFESHMIGATGNGADTHEYDGDGRRMRSKLNSASDWTNFIYDETISGYPCLICEYTLVSGTFTIHSLNTWGLGLISTNRGGTKRFFHFDALGSTAALTSSSGSRQDTYTYSAFGILESSSGSSVNPFRYVGQSGYYDDEARGSGYEQILADDGFYFPSVGTFASSFNLGTDPGGGVGQGGRQPVGCPSGYTPSGTCSKGTHVYLHIHGCKGGKAGTSYSCRNLVCPKFDTKIDRTTPGNCGSCAGLLLICIDTYESIPAHKEDVFLDANCTCEQCTVEGWVSTTACVCCRKKSVKKPLPVHGKGTL